MDTILCLSWLYHHNNKRQHVTTDVHFLTFSVHICLLLSKYVKNDDALLYCDIPKDGSTMRKNHWSQTWIQTGQKENFTTQFYNWFCPCHLSYLNFPSWFLIMVWALLDKIEHHRGPKRRYLILSSSRRATISAMTKKVENLFWFRFSKWNWLLRSRWLGWKIN